MTPKEFRAWLRFMGWSKQVAAERLGLGPQMVGLYCKGWRLIDGKVVQIDIPKSVELACAALQNNIREYQPPTTAAS